jgi:uncharacterized membrane protein
MSEFLNVISIVLAFLAWQSISESRKETSENQTKLTKKIKDLEQQITANSYGAKISITPTGSQGVTYQPVTKEENEPIVSPQATQTTPVRSLSETVVTKPIEPQVQSTTPLVPKTIEENKPGILENLGSWLMQDFLMKIGAILIILAVGWFVAVGLAGMGPVMRVLVGLVIGVVILLAGYWQMPNRLVAGQVLSLTGTTILLIDILSARFGYNLINLVVTLGCCVGVVGLNTLVAIRYKARPLAIISIVLGFLTPMISVGGPSNFVGLMSYLAILNLSTFTIAWQTKWKSIQTISILGTAFYLFSSRFSVLLSGDTVWAWLFGFLFITIFYFSSIFSSLGKKLTSPLDITNSLLTVMFCFGVVAAFVFPLWQPVILIAYTLFIAIVAFVFQAKGLSKDFVLIQMGAGMLSLMAATVLQIGPNSNFTPMMLVAELTIAQLLYSRQKNSYKTVKFIIFATTLVISIMAGMSTFAFLINWKDLVAIGVITILAGVNARLAFNQNEDDQDTDFNIFGWGFGIFSFLIGIRWIWNLFEVAFVSNGQFGKDFGLAHGLALTVYIILSIVGLSQLLPLHKKLQTYFAYTLITFVLVRLIFVEVWNMAATARIGTFFIIGILLVMTAFIKRKRE